KRAPPATKGHPDYQRVICDHDCTDFYVRSRYQMDHAIHKGIHPPAGTRGVWTPQQSQSITIREADGQPHGIQQGGLLLQAGRAYDIRLVMKGEGQRVTVGLGDQTWTIEGVSDAWQTYRQQIVMQQVEENGRFSITFTDEATLWVARASLMPADNVEGFRADVIEAIKENWTPTWLRWPGGNFASAYHWMDGIGDRDKRPPYLDPAWQIWEYHDVGTDDFITFCRLIDSEPVLTINMGTGGPEEAAAWVEYCNGDASTKYGAMRAANGHPEPYNVKTWFVGNEQFGNWQDGHVDAETYARRYLEYSEAMLAVDPELFLPAVGVPSDHHRHWNERVLKVTGSKMDALSVHHYSVRTMSWPEPPSEEDLVPFQLTASHEIDLLLQDTIAIAKAHSNPAVPLAFDEWNTYLRAKPPLFIESYNLADGLYTGGVMNSVLQRCNDIIMSAPFNFTNVMGNYRITQGSVWATPSTLVLDLMTRFRGKVAVECQVIETPTFGSPAIAQQIAYEDVATINAAATFDEANQRLFLSLVNFATEQAATIQLDGLDLTGVAEIYQITAVSATALNTEEEPQAVQIKQSEWKAGGRLTVPPLSFSLISIPVAR
ncbi:MAG: alpha-L-arabinofuranosidase C-terminal domain-containing protein, partial [Chloroflexota bacterium]